MASNFSRRAALKNALALGAGVSALGLSGCKDLVDVLGQACPENPAEEGGIDWVPDVMHPVAHGFRDLDVADGAPGPVRVWYPTYEVFPDGPAHPVPILKHCLARWPVVLFLHGQPPCPIPNYNRTWTDLPADLARSGYVVVAPQHEATLPADNSSAPFVASFIDWARSGWEHSRWVDKRGVSTAVVGHSYGALLTARVAQIRSDVAACVCLSGPWDELNDKIATLNAINRPTFFMWAVGPFFENLDDHGVWDQLAFTKYGASFPGEHFDYITQPPGCGQPRGGCGLIKSAAADLVALFLSRYVPVAASKTDIPLTLIPFPAPLTPKQQFYGANRLSGVDLIQHQTGCHIDLKWREDSLHGSRVLGT
jgi:pimeloyl-ACP methyl ester carboxylesterase